MDTLIQAAVGVIALAMLGLGGKSMLSPSSMLENFAVDPRGTAGLNTIRGVIGGLFIGAVGMLVTGLVTGQTIWFMAVASILGAVALGRLLGLLADGFDRAVVPPLVVELAMVVVLLAAHLRLGD